MSVVSFDLVDLTLWPSACDGPVRNAAAGMAQGPVRQGRFMPVRSDFEM